jgi:hypothetical protein
MTNGNNPGGCDATTVIHARRRRPISALQLGPRKRVAEEGVPATLLPVRVATEMHNMRVSLEKHVE